MRTNTIITAGILAISAGLVGCGAPAANTNANKPANTNANKPAANAPANTTAANTAAAPASDGQVIKLDEAGIMMTVPKGFKFSKDGEDTIVKTEDEGVDIRFTVPKDGDYEKAMGDAGTEIDDYLDDVKIEEGCQNRRRRHGSNHSERNGEERGRVSCLEPDDHKDAEKAGYRQYLR